MKVLVTNVGGNKHKPKGLDLKPGEKQRKVAVNIIQSYKPDLILAQEGKKIFYDTVCNECNDGVLEYRYVYNEEAGILYNVVDWTIKETKADLVKMYDELVHQNIISRESELKARFHALILKSKGPDGNFLCVSYHGHYTGKTGNKKLEILKDFLILLLNYLKSIPDIPLILGGDFNVEFDNDTLQTLIQNGKAEQMLNMLNPSLYWSPMSFGFPPTPDLYLISYIPTVNRDNIYDQIIVSSTIIVNEIQAIDVVHKIAELFPEVFEEYYKVILDHDPIFLTLEIDVTKM